MPKCYFDEIFSHDDHVRTHNDGGPKAGKGRTQDCFFWARLKLRESGGIEGCNLRWILCCEHANEYLELQICEGCRNKVPEMVDQVLRFCKMFDPQFFHRAGPIMDERKNFSILWTLIDE